MSKHFEINNNLSIEVISDIDDVLLTRTFYENLYRNIFSYKDNNLKAGLINMTTPNSVMRQIDNWLVDDSNYMFFLYEGNEIVGTTQSFNSNEFGDNTLTLGYIVSPNVQGKGYGTLMLKFVSEYLHKLGINIVLGFRDGNVASERIAAKNNYSYLTRMNQVDALGEIRPMTYYKYNGKPLINESYNVIPNSKILTTNQWVDDRQYILSRINPKMLNLEEYVYLCTSSNKPKTLNETYFLFSSAHYNLVDRLKKEKIKSKNFALSDKASNTMFNPATKGDIVLTEFCNLVDSDLDLLEINEDKTSMILGNKDGEIKIRLLDNILMVEEYILTK